MTLTSSHSRLIDELCAPTHDPDPQRARTLCAEICRELLADLAPVLLLLPAAERRRVQALTAYTRTLVDFALDDGMHGERLARINRWEFSLEQALDGEAPGQPVFVAMATVEADRPWARHALDGLSVAARRLALGATLDETAAALAGNIAEALLGTPPPTEIVGFGSRLLTTVSQRGSADRLAMDAPLPGEARPWRSLERDTLASVPAHWRRALRFLAAAGDSPRTLTLATRVRLLLIAWLGR